MATSAPKAAPDLTEEQRREIVRDHQRKQREERLSKMSPEQLAKLNVERKKYSAARNARLAAERAANPELAKAHADKQKAYHDKRAADLANNPELAARHAARQKEYHAARSLNTGTVTERIQKIKDQEARLASVRRELESELKSS